MAELSDVMNDLVALIGEILFPNGSGQPSIIGSCITIFPGWPNPQQLATDLAKGTCEVSVYPRPEERNTTRYMLRWQEKSRNTPTLTLTIAGLIVTVGGTVPPVTNPHNAVVFVNRIPYVYAVQVSDTPSSIATALAALIAVDLPGTSASGPVITVPSTARLTAARIGVTGTGVREIRRQERTFQIGIWADTPAHRDAIAKPLDLALAGMTFMTLSDGSAARLRYKGSPLSDLFEKTSLYRRDLYYTVEYATFQTETETEITQEILTVGVDGISPEGEPLVTVYS